MVPGVVEAIGSSVTRVRPGDEVFFFNNGLGGAPGTYAEYTVVQEDYLALKPKNITMLEAAGIPLALITAWEALLDRGNLQKGQSILIHAGAGGLAISRFSLPISSTRGWQPPFQVREKAEFVQSTRRRTGDQLQAAGFR